MDDAMKRFMKIKANVHKLCAADRVIRRWLLSLRSKMENVMEKKKLMACLHGGWDVKNLHLLGVVEIHLREDR